MQLSCVHAGLHIIRNSFDRVWLLWYHEIHGDSSCSRFDEELEIREFSRETFQVVSVDSWDCSNDYISGRNFGGNTYEFIEFCTERTRGGLPVRCKLSMRLRAWRSRINFEAYQPAKYWFLCSQQRRWSQQRLIEAQVFLDLADFTSAKRLSVS